MKINVNEIQLIKRERLEQSILLELDPSVYESRHERLRARMHDKGIDVAIIYGDREHYSDLFFLTGYDPRFEESLYIVPKDARPTLLVGNEGIGYSGIINIEHEKALFQSFSLLGQSRSTSTPDRLVTILKGAGITKSSTVGIIDWKYQSSIENDDWQQAFMIPEYLMKEIRKITGDKNIKHVSDIMMNPGDGLRVILDVHDLAAMEIAGTKTSWSVIQLLQNVRLGMSEIKASSLMALDGDPLCAHPNLNFTRESASLGLRSPGSDPLRLGSILNLGVGYRSSMVARTGTYVHSLKELKTYWGDILENLYIPYQKILTTWYEMLDLGVHGSSIVSEIEHYILKDFMSIGLNPGHLIHTDEWTNSPFVTDQDVALQSGMGIQCDIIAGSNQYFGVHVEDGLALADSALRYEFSKRYPDSFARTQERRLWMKDSLGIELSESVLPFSDIQATLNPCMGNLSLALVKE